MIQTDGLCIAFQGAVKHIFRVEEDSETNRMSKPLEGEAFDSAIAGLKDKFGGGRLF